MNEGLSNEILPIKMFRKFVRLQRAYLLAYKDGLDIVQSEAWIKQHKSHRGYAEQMVAKLEQLYFPLGHNVDESVPALENIVENRPEVENALEIDDENDTMYRHGIRSSKR